MKPHQQQVQCIFVMPGQQAVQSPHMSHSEHVLHHFGRREVPHAVPTSAANNTTSTETSSTLVTVLLLLYMLLSRCQATESPKGYC